MVEFLLLNLISAVYLAPDCSKQWRKFMGISWGVIALIVFFTKVYHA